MKRTSTTLILLTLAVATHLLAAERSTIDYKGMSVRDPAPYGEAGLAWQNNFKALADRIGPCKFDATTAPTAGDDTTAGYATGSLWLDTAANRLYWCASAAAGAAVWIEVSPADLSAVYQPLDADLTTWSGVASSADGRAIVSAADYAAMRGLLGLAIGADVQSHSANLDTWAGVLPSANGQSLVSAADYAAMRGLLGLEPGTDVQAYSSRLGAIAALTPTDGNLIVGNGTTWVTQSGATARTTLGLGTLATQGAGAVAITGGEITGITDLAVADGGTGASDAAGARGNLGFTAPILDKAAPGDIGATTPATIKATTLETTGAISLGGAPEAGFPLKAYQTAHNKGFKIVGYDTQSSYYYQTGVGQYGNAVMSTNGYMEIASGAGKLLYINAGGDFAGSSIVLFNGTTGNKELVIHGRDTIEGVAKDARLRVTTTGTFTVLAPPSENIVLGARGGTNITIAPTGELSIPSDTVGLNLDAAGTTTLISNGTVATLSKPLKAAGYQASDGSAGINQTIAITDKSDVTHTMVFKNGLLTSYSTAP